MSSWRIRWPRLNFLFWKGRPRIHEILVAPTPSPASSPITEPDINATSHRPHQNEGLSEHESAQDSPKSPRVKKEDGQTSGEFPEAVPTGEDGQLVCEEQGDVGRASEEGDRAAPQMEAVQRSIQSVLHGSDDTNIASLLESPDGQLIIDETWKLYTQPSAPDEDLLDQRGKLRRLCLKLVLNFSTLPSVMFLTDVQYQDGDLHGIGAFADVFRGRYRGAAVAVKRLREFANSPGSQKIQLTKSLYRESLLWKMLDHQHVLPFLGVSKDALRNRMFYMVLPWMENGGIREYISKLQSEGTLQTSGPEFMHAVNSWLHQISLGLAYLHEQLIVHGDLHCGNILVDSDGNIRLADFGMALIADATSYNYASVHGGGAIHTRAPELLDPEATSTRQTPACDVYAFAFVCVELYTGKRPFPGVPDFQIISHVQNGGRPPRPLLSDSSAMSSALWSLIVKCWSTEPSRRPTSRLVSQTMGDIANSIAGGTPSALNPKQICTFGIDIFTSLTSPLAISRDYFVIGTFRGEIKVFSVRTGKLLHVLRASGLMVNAVVVMGQTLVSVAPDNAVRIWSLVTGRCVHVFKGHTSSVRYLTITYPSVVDVGIDTAPGANSPSQEPLIVSGSRDGSLRVWAVPPLQDEPKPREWRAMSNPYHRHHLRGLRDTAMSLDVQGNIAASSADGEVWVWDILAGTRKCVLHHDGTQVRSVFLDVKRNLALVRVWGTTVHIWDIHTGERQHILDIGSSNLCLLSSSYLVTGSDAGPEIDLTVWDPSSRIAIQQLSCPNPNPRSLGTRSFLGQDDTQLRYNHDNTKIVGGSYDSVSLWDIQTGTLVGGLHTGRFTVDRVAFEGELCVVVLTKSGQAKDSFLVSLEETYVVVWDFGERAEGVPVEITPLVPS